MRFMRAHLRLFKLFRAAAETDEYGVVSVGYPNEAVEFAAQIQPIGQDNKESERGVLPKDRYYLHTADALDFRYNDLCVLDEREFRVLSVQKWSTFTRVTVEEIWKT